MTSPRIALVTGANQGLGFALAQGLAARLTAADRVLLIGRDAGRVARAADAVRPARAQVEGRTLDVRDPAAITALADELGGVDIVFSNAAARMTPDRTPAEMIDAVVATNNLATTRMLRAFLPSCARAGGCSWSPAASGRWASSVRRSARASRARARWRRSMPS